MIKATTSAPDAAVKTLGVVMFKSETGCCPTGLTQCEYSITNAAIYANVRSITVTLPDGTDATWTLTSADYASASALIEFIRTQAKAIGYEFSEKYGIEIGSKSVDIDGTTITIISELVFKNIVTATPSTVNFTAKCTRVSVCDYQIFFEGDAATATLTFEGTDYTLEDDFSYPGSGTTQADNLVAEIDDALGDVDGYFGCSVEKDASAGTNGEGGYVVTIQATYGKSISIDGVAAAMQSCAQDWIS